MNAYSDEQDARDSVLHAAIHVVDSWENLNEAVRALRSLYADNGLRDSSTPGEQATDSEPAHREDRNERNKS
jgi:hypothetical protein